MFYDGAALGMLQYPPVVEQVRVVWVRESGILEAGSAWLSAACWLPAPWGCKR